MCWSDLSAAESADAEANLALSQNPTLATIAAVAPFLVPFLPEFAAADTGPAATLELAQQVAGVPTPFWQTVALLETAEGPTLVAASGGSALTAAQIAEAESVGLTVAESVPGLHAEEALINAAGNMGLTPTAPALPHSNCYRR
jgi:hypothetical protein